MRMLKEPTSVIVVSNKCVNICKELGSVPGALQSLGQCFQLDQGNVCFLELSLLRKRNNLLNTFHMANII